MKWVLPMKFFQDSLETFFLNVFNSSVPAYSGDDSHTRATIVRELREKYPGCINGYQSGRDIIDYDGVYRANSWQVDVEAAERQMINEIIEIGIVNAKTYMVVSTNSVAVPSITSSNLHAQDL